MSKNRWFAVAAIAALALAAMLVVSNASDATAPKTFHYFSGLLSSDSGGFGLNAQNDTAHTQTVTIIGRDQGGTVLTPSSGTSPLTVLPHHTGFIGYLCGVTACGDAFEVITHSKLVVPSISYVSPGGPQTQAVTGGAFALR